MLIMNDIIFFIISICDVGNFDYNFFEKYDYFLMMDVLERIFKWWLIRWISLDKVLLFIIYFIGLIDCLYFYLEKFV